MTIESEEIEEESSGSLEDDIREMRTKNRKLTAELKERDELLGPALEAQRRELVRDGGFDPGSTEGKRLIRAMADGEIQPDGSDLTEVAEKEYGYAPSLSRHSLTDAEFVAQYHADRLGELAAVTVSNDPPSDEQAIAEAEAAGDWQRAKYLKSGKLSKFLEGPASL